MAGWVDACATDAIEAEDLIRLDHLGKTFAIEHGPGGGVSCTAGLRSHHSTHSTGAALRAPACVNPGPCGAKVEGVRVFVEI